MRIAYVEDNATNLALVERVIRITKHELVTYDEGEIALEALQRESFDLILMDVELAGEMDGLEVVRVLHEKGLTTPIVALTAYAMMGDRDRIIAAGCDDYLPKPLSINDFLSLLARYEAAFKANQNGPEQPHTPGAEMPQPAKPAATNPTQEVTPPPQSAPAITTTTPTPSSLPPPRPAADMKVAAPAPGQTKIISS